MFERYTQRKKSAARHLLRPGMRRVSSAVPTSTGDGASAARPSLPGRQTACQSLSAVACLAVDSIRRSRLKGTPRFARKFPLSVDLPLSHECKRVLAYGAEEAERLNHKHIGTEHLLLGLLREEKCFAAEILHERGLRLSTIREELQRSQSEKVATQTVRREMLAAG